MLARIEQLIEDVLRGDARPRKLPLYLLYTNGSLRDCQNLFVLDCPRGAPVFAHGAMRPGVVPRFFKVCLDARDDPSLADDYGPPARVVPFFLAPNDTDSGHCLLATLARAPGAADLSLRPAVVAVN